MIVELIHIIVDDGKTDSYEYKTSLQFKENKQGRKPG